MTLAVSQLSDVIRLMSELNTLVNQRIELASQIANVTFPARAEVNKFLRQLEESQGQFDETSRKYEMNLQKLMDLVADPMKLEDDRLEQLATGIAELDKDLLKDAESARNMIDAYDELNSLRRLVCVLVTAGPDIMFRLRKCVRQSIENDRRVICQVRSWQDSMSAMKMLVELGSRRPLTKEEKIQLTQVSVIHTPVIQEPSDSRADWYDDDGR